MKITIEHYDKVITYQMSDDSTLTEMVYTLDLLLKCTGYVYDGELDIVPVEGDLEDSKDND